MEPRTKVEEQEREPEKFRLQEQFVRQVEDDSLPAQEVLSEQQAGHEPADVAPLFVP